MKVLKKIGLFLIPVILVFLIHYLQITMDRDNEIHFVDTRPVFLPNGSTLKALSMGYRGVLGDVLWIRSVLYYGRRVIDEDNPYFVYAQQKGTLNQEIASVRRESESPGSDDVRVALKHILYKQSSRGLVRFIYPLLDRVADLDPHFTFPYIFGGVYVLLDTGEEDKAEALLKRGLVANPDRWEFPFYLGWLYWMYKGDKISTYKYLSDAIKIEGCPEYVENLYAGLSKNLGRREEAKIYLKGLIESTDNKELKNQLQKALAKLESE